jgi:hypothetical protein
MSSETNVTASSVRFLLILIVFTRWFEY